MSRAQYDDCLDSWDLIRWRGAVAQATRGARGQAFLREMLAALDAMPEKRLIRNELVRADGAVCALGAVACARGLDASKIEPEEPEQVAGAFGIAPALAREIAYENDETHVMRGDALYDEGERLWRHMRAWVQKQIKAPTR